MQLATRAGLALAVVNVACDTQDPATKNSVDVVTVNEVTFFASDSLFEAIDVFVADEGDVWVLSAYQPHIHLFRSDGSLVRAFGRNGPGPTELRAPLSFAGESSDRHAIEVWDAGRRQIIQFAASGQVVGSIDVPVGTGQIVGEFKKFYFGEPGRAMRAADGYVVDHYDTRVLVPNDTWAGYLVFTDSTGERRGSIALSAFSRPHATSGSFPIYDPIPLWDVCSDGRVGILDPSQHILRWVDSRGNALSRDTVRLEEIPVTESDVRRYVAMRLTTMGSAANERLDTTSPDVKRQIDQTITELANELPKAGPPVRIRCGGQGELWIQEFATAVDARGYGDRWLVFDTRSPSRRVQFPPGFTPLHFTRSMIVGIQRDSFGAVKAAYAAYPRLN